ncbi:hypothetical protein MKUB_34520 [Mycobacterium kubicae]|uniref:Uncharacterized protein n=1 Tax=Mycobacterium kubicae TaxID=120959 RepID=A0ABQ1BQH7_9MYCO|nr:hypothetical protein MKUB_34520 [Mycobacterium kubicae]
MTVTCQRSGELLAAITDQVISMDDRNPHRVSLLGTHHGRLELREYPMLSGRETL